jgi:hypothetical protein
MYGSGTKLGDDWFEPRPGMTMYFYDRGSIDREFAGIVEVTEIDEPAGRGTFPFFNVLCQ